MANNFKCKILDFMEEILREKGESSLEVIPAGKELGTSHARSFPCGWRKKCGNVMSREQEVQCTALSVVYHTHWCGPMAQTQALGFSFCNVSA